MSRPLDFSGRVAVVTGAGTGLGREHALELARRGASVVVNDLGVTVQGEGSSSEAAAKVVKEIEDAGGRAIANHGSVTSVSDMEAMAAQALSAFGRIDILVANAGFLRDTSFKKMTMEAFAQIIEVHLLGAAYAAKAVWPTMTEAGYGRIIFTTSTSGLFGNFGQANYSAGKMGVVGLMNTLKVEGRKSDIRVNAISPQAVTRMNEALVPADLAPLLHPRHVAAAVAFLASPDAPTGVILNAGAGYLSVTEVVERPGVILPVEHASAEDVAAAWQDLPKGQDGKFFDAGAHAGAMLDRLRASLA
jgi:NAD(P)-dependent dehydrogenase (short-subunit alcohol dehydrogenase family)